jgi:hypothetical protein
MSVLDSIYTFFIFLTASAAIIAVLSKIFPDDKQE